jgi:tetratricopeptide (TPR) repeat protein
VPFRRAHTVFLSGLLILIAGFVPSRAYSQQGWSIVGKIETFRGELPDRRILITLQFRGNTIATTYCDSEGKFFFPDLLANAYHILVDDEMYRAVDQIVDINPMVTAPTMVRLSLVPKEATNAQVPVSGSNPNMVNSIELKQFPKAALKEFDKGTKSDRDGKLDDAIEHYRKAIAVAPGLYLARNNLGSAYLKKQQFANAREQFEEVIKLNQTDAAGYFNLGNLFFLQNQYLEAVHWIGEGLTKEPNSSFGHFLMGSSFVRLGRVDLSEK